MRFDLFSFVLGIAFVLALSWVLHRVATTKARAASRAASDDRPPAGPG